MREPDLVEEWNTERTGWALFDGTRKHRYRLGRAVSLNAKELCGVMDPSGMWNAPGSWLTNEGLRRVVFVMLNPSTADAFKGDRTVDKCIRFAELWGFDVLEVVNIFSLRTPYPEDVRQAHEDDRGAGSANDEQIIRAIERPNVQRVVAAWGNHGELGLRGEYVRGMLEEIRARSRGFELVALKKLPSGHPIHPLARGKEFIPLTIEPVRYP